MKSEVSKPPQTGRDRRRPIGHGDRRSVDWSAEKITRRPQDLIAGSLQRNLHGLGAEEDIPEPRLI